MPSQIYEVVAQGARYWFLFLMVLIAWRSWRWYRRDKRQMKKRLRLLPDAGYVGEMVVMNDGGPLKRGAVFPVPWEGTLGALRTNDICLPLPGIARKHLWFRFDEGVGLRVEPFGKNQTDVDGTGATRRQPLYMAHGSYLLVGDVELRLRLFAGFESVGRARYVSVHDAQPQPDQTAPAEDENAQMMRQMLLQPQKLHRNRPAGGCVAERKEPFPLRCIELPHRFLASDILPANQLGQRLTAFCIPQQKCARLYAEGDCRNGAARQRLCQLADRASYSADDLLRVMLRKPHCGMQQSVRQINSADDPPVSTNQDAFCR